MIGPLLLALACAPRPLEVEARVVDGGVEVRADRALDRVAVATDGGGPVATTRPSGALVYVPAPLEPGRGYRVTAWAGEERVELPVVAPDDGPLAVWVEAPVGQGRRAVRDGDVVPLVVVDGAAPTVAVHVGARSVGDVEIALGDRTWTDRIDGPDDRVVVRAPVAEDLDLVIRGADGVVAARIDVTAQTLDEARARVAVTALAFPADAQGRADPARPPDRVTLPAGWWRDGLAELGLGWRPRGDQAPWAWQTVTLHNAGPDAVGLVVRASVRQGGAASPAFRARLREGPSDEVTALLRVPPGEDATAVLPVYVDASALPEGGVFARVVEVVPLGADRPLHVVEAPLAVTVGSRWASGGFAIGLLASALGYALLAARGRSWLAARRTAELVTVALFASLTFVVGAAFQVLGVGVATVLGPFAPLLTGLPDDAFRACLLGTLVTLIPRPGVVALATVVGFLMRGLALGSFHPVDLLYVGSAVFWLEGSLWVFGLTRGEAWREGTRTARWLRLGLGFGLANVCATANALVISVVLYRLWFAGWYVALVLALPGFLYVLAGCWLAVDFAAALRRVEA